LFNCFLTLIQTSLVLAALFSGSVCANVSRTANDRVDIYHQRNELAQLLGRDPRNSSLNAQARSNLYFRLGILDLRSQRYADAVDDFGRVLTLTTSVPALVDRGIACSGLGNLETALANYSTAISLNPKLTIPLINRADIYAQRKQFELAIQDYPSVLALQPDAAAAYFGRAISWFKLERYSLAASDYSKAATLRPIDVQLTDWLAFRMIAPANSLTQSPHIPQPYGLRLMMHILIRNAGKPIRTPATTAILSLISQPLFD
jgi:tetratricopeptide (TPR) repeat protein